MISSERVRQLLSLHGDLQPQSPADWAGVFPLPVSLKRFYQEVGPANVTIESYGNPFFLPQLRELWEFQAGYRWDGLTGEPAKDWDVEWLVVADQGGDPFILSLASEKVLHDAHGRGVWEPGELFPDLSAMAACLAQLGVVVNSAGKDFTDEESRIRPEHREYALAGLRELLGTTVDAECVLKVLGWG
jgi:hypothetical protein